MTEVEMRKKLKDYGYRDETINKIIDLGFSLPLDDLSEPKTTVAAFILPPETSVDVQSMHITNLSNIELEINLRITGVIKEIATKT